MAETFRGTFVDRELFPEALTRLDRLHSNSRNWRDFVRHPIPARGAAVGTWSMSPGDPLSEVLVVRDEDFQDTMSWVNSFFAALSPITQWCRVLQQSQAIRIANRTKPVALGHMLGPWVGAVLAECSVQAGGLQNLRDLPGSAATSSATFAAGRAEAVWYGEGNLAEIARRHDELSLNLRDGSRPLGAQALIPVWSVLSGRLNEVNPNDRGGLGPFTDILSKAAALSSLVDPVEAVASIADHAASYFELEELLGCAKGPQVERVRALDRLGERLASGPKSAAIDALLGLGASFVDPGMVIAPELLRRHGRQLPVAPIWQGVFAGAISPLRAMTDQGGLGRLIAKALLAVDDFQGRPTCDIAYEELVRWITPGRSLKLDLRGMSARVLSVELLAGVTCAFAFGRTDGPIAPALPPKVDAHRVVEARTRIGRSVQELDVVVMNLQQRIEQLEAGRPNSQRSLNLPEPKESKSRKRDKS